MTPKSAVISGLGFVTCLGNDAAEVVASLRDMRCGLREIDLKPGLEGARRMVGRPAGFSVESPLYLKWSIPPQFKLSRDLLRGLPPHGVYATCAALQALQDSGLEGSPLLSDGSTALFCASVGSPLMLVHHLGQLQGSTCVRGSPFGVISSVAGTLNFNLGAFLKIRGGNCGFVSACSSSTHALGFALDEVRLGRHERVLVVAAEENCAETVLPFAGMRALSDSLDPELASCPFDVRRNGFSACGGAAALLVESEEAARARGARSYARFLGWAHTGDGYSQAMPEPEGAGLRQSMLYALKDAGIDARDVEYVNAHATSTPAGDSAEARAIRAVFTGRDLHPAVSSLKGLTGHGLSFAGAQETACCVLAMNAGFTPGCAHLREPDPEAAPLNLPRENLPLSPRFVLKNNAGFGGSNVSLVLASIE